MRIMIDICYDGSDFEGFATQPHGRTVADTLMVALAKIYKQPIYIYGSSRTDSKVSAKTQYIVFDQPFSIEPDNLVKAINGTVDKRISCKSAVNVADGYMPRYDVGYKTYTYTITSEYIPFLRHLEYYVKHDLDVKAMQEAAKYLVGTHDFSSFCSANTDVKDKVRTVMSLDVNKVGNKTLITISGDGFLYNMVRIISGTLLVIGLGKYEPSYMKTILEAQSRKLSFATAPAHGLMLEKIVLKGTNE